MKQAKRYLIDVDNVRDSNVRENEKSLHHRSHRGSGMTSRNYFLENAASLNEKDEEDEMDDLYREMEDLYREEDNGGMVAAA